MAGYIRQSTFSDGDTITAALFNNEYDQLLNVFSNTSGHKHDGTAAEGPVIGLIGDAGLVTPLNKILIDTTNDHIEFWIDVSGTSTQQLYIADGAILPVTDNDIDLGSSSLEFKDLYIDGTANIDSLVADTADINGGSIDGAVIGANSAAAGTFTTVTTTSNVVVGGNLTVSGTTTTVNSNEVNIGDNIIVLNSDETGTPSQNGGIEVERGTSTNVSLLWNETNDYWTFGSDHLNFPDNSKAYFGDSNDLQIYHSSGNNFINAPVGGNLILQANTVTARSVAQESMINAAANGAVTLYYDNSAKLDTTSAGIDVTGQIELGDSHLIGDDGFDNLALVSSSGENLLLGSANDLYFNTNATSLSSTGNTRMYISGTNGRVGIGTLTPSRQLTVQNSGNAIAAIVSGTSSLAQLAFGDTDDDNYAQIILENSTNKLQIQNGGGGAVGDRGITLDSSENVGIGTESPVRNLHLHESSSSLNYMKFSNTTTGTTGTDGFEIGINGDEHAVIYQRENLDIKFRTNNTDRVIFKNDGNVGIGTTSPGARLQINGSSADSSAHALIARNSGGTSLFSIRNDGRVDIPTGNLNVTNDVAVSGNLTVTGNATINGNLTFGNAATDTVSFGADIDSNIIPDDDNTYDLGSSSQEWKDLYIDGVIYADQIDLGDNEKIRLGASQDLEIYHDGSHSYVKDNGTGNLTLAGTNLYLTTTNGQILFKGLTDAETALYYDNAEKLTTTSTGVQITGTLDVDVISNASGVVHLNDTLYLQDNSKAVFGDSSDLQIYHDGSHSYVKDTGTGNLKILADNLLLQRGDASQTYIQALTGGAVDLRHAGNVKLATTSTGIDVTGGADAIAKVTGTTTAARLDLATNSHHRFWQLIESDGRARFYDQTANAERFTINSSGKVGIGISSPVEKLDVSGNIQTNDTIILNNGSVKWQHLVNSNAYTLRYNGGAWNEYLRISVDGNVGIGTTSPNQKLVVVDTGGETTLAIDNATTTTGNHARLDFRHNGITGSQIKSENIEDFTTSANRTSDLQFYTRNNGTIAERLRIKEDGKVGIGTTSPSDKVEVYANGADVALKIHEDAGTHTARLHLREGTQDTYIQNRAGNGFEIRTENNISTSSTAAMQITAGGDITTGYNLTVGGNLTVSGTTTTLNTATLDVEDKNITLNKGSGDTSASADGAGITIQDAVDASTDATLLWDATNDKFDFSHSIQVPDNANVKVGSAGDLFMVHNGTNSFIQNKVGDLYLENASDDKDIFFRSDDGSGGLATYMTIDGSHSRISVAKEFIALDNVPIRVGSGGDAEFKHDGSNTYLINKVGDFYIQNTADDKDIIFQSDDGSGGVTSYFQLDGSEVVTSFLKTTRHLDNVKAMFGSSNDLQIYHDGSNSYIKDGGTGTLRILSDDVRIMNAAGTEISAQFIQDGEARLKYDNATKLATKSTGIEVTGSTVTDGITLTGTGTDNDSHQINFVNGACAIARDNNDLELHAYNAMVFGVSNTSYPTSTERMRIDSSGNVGIGTTSPSHDLHIEATDDLAFRLTRTGVRSFSQYIGSTGKFIIRDLSGTPADRLAIDTSGNVGIGTTSPSTKLDVSGFQRNTLGAVFQGSSNLSSGAGLEVGYNSGGSYSFIQSYDRTNSAYKDTRIIGSKIDFDIANSVKATIDSSGRLLINTTSSLDNNSLLHIKGFSSGHAGIVMQDQDNTNAKTFFKQTGGATEIQTQNNTAHGVFKVTGWNGTASAEFMRVDGATGRVGIGTSSPATPLHILGTFRSQMDGNAAKYINLFGGNSGNFIDSHGNTLFLRPNATTSLATKLDTSGNLLVAGSVGVGTDSPSQKLHVAKSGESYARVESTSGGGARLQLKTETVGYAAYSKLDFIYGASDTVAFSINGGDTVNTMAFDVGGSERMRINSSGNVGIGTQTPSAGLHLFDKTLRIQKSASDRKLEFLDDRTGANHFSIEHDVNQIYFYNVTTTESPLIIKNNGDIVMSAGNVGLGTSSPEEKLEVNGNIRMQSPVSTTSARPAVTVATLNSGEIRAKNTDSSDGGLLRLSAGAGTTQSTMSYIDLQGYSTAESGNAKHIIFGTSGSDKMIIDSSGNVGIGNDTPLAKLDVTGQINIRGTTGLYLNAANGTTFRAAFHDDGTRTRLFADGNGSNPSMTFNGGNVGVGLTGTNHPSARLHVQGSGATVTSLVECTDGNQASLDLKNSEGHYRIITNSGQLQIYDETDSRQPFTIDTSGNVGIGTTSARHKLSVNGTLGSSTFSGFGLGVVGGLATAESGTPNAAMGLQCTSASSSKIFAYDYAGSAAIPISIQPDNANVFICAGGGNVGIGTTSPGTLLHLSNASDPTVRVQDSSSGMVVGLQANDSAGFVGTTSNSDFAIRTNNSTRLHVENNGNIGIGTTSPYGKLNIFTGTSGGTSNIANQLAGSWSFANNSSGTAAPALIGKSNTNVGSQFIAATNNSNTTGDMHFNVRENDNTDFATTTSPAFKFQRFTTDLMTILRDGKVGIGTTSPANKLDVSGTINTDNAYKLDNQTLIEQTGSNIYFGDRDDNDNIVDLSGFSEQAKIVLNDGFMTLSTGGSERARIDSSGNFVVGKTSLANATDGIELNSTGQFVASFTSNTHILNRNGTDGAILSFLKAGTTVGSVSVTGSATTYNTSSDARLKDITGSARGLEVINKLNPVAYDWKADGKSDEGLIAQEVMELVPNAVSGSEEDMYQMDYSKLVVHLVKGMQEQQKEIEELKKHSHSPKGLENMEGYENLIETIESLKAEIKLLKGGN